jgi:MerR family redox-sensitive transcriptional activator SoxR
MNQTTFTIGQLAQRLGLNASAIRYYERVGVLPEPAREGGRRRYDAEAVKRVERLQTAKQAGFTLQEAQLLLQRSQAGDPLHEPLRELAARKLPEVEALLARTTSLRAWLLAATGCSCETLDACALFSDAASEGNTTPLQVRGASGRA